MGRGEGNDFRGGRGGCRGDEGSDTRSQDERDESRVGGEDGGAGAEVVEVEHLRV